MVNYYKIAKIIVKLEYNSKYVEHIFSPFLIEEKSSFDVHLFATEQEILSELQLMDEKYVDLAESTALLRKLANILLKNFNCLLFHSSAIMYNENAFLFTAPSGTGKSTHTKLLKELLNDSVLYINDDKPLLKLENQNFTVYSSPWLGKHYLGNNLSAPLKAIVLINRANENFAKKLSYDEALKVVFEQTVNAKDDESAQNYLNLVLQLVNGVDFYLLNCTKNVESAKYSFENILSKY